MVDELETINRPDRVAAIMAQIKSAAAMYNHCYCELVKKGMTNKEYYENVKRV